MDRVLPQFLNIFSLFPIIEQLETMITDENAMFDVLGDFFYHVNTKVRVAALEVSLISRKKIYFEFSCLFTFENIFFSSQVYERRALVSYDIEGLMHEQIGDDISAIMFKFRLPEGHPNR